MRVAYEHVRLAPSNEIAKQITETLLEDFIAEANPSETKTLDEMTTAGSQKMYTHIFGSDTDTDEDEKLRPIGTARAMLT